MASSEVYSRPYHNTTHSSYLEDPSSGEDEWAGTDFSGCGDPETFMRFLEASNYCLGYSDSDDGGYDPS